MKLKLMTPQEPVSTPEPELKIMVRQERSGNVVIMAGIWYLIELVVEGGKLKLFRHSGVGDPDKIAVDHNDSNKIALTNKYQD